MNYEISAIEHAIAALQEEVHVLRRDVTDRKEHAEGMQQQIYDCGKEITILSTAINELRSREGSDTKKKPPHRRLIDEKGEFIDVAGQMCVFRQPRQRRGVGELYIGSSSGGITLNYALIEELIPILQQFLDTGAFPWEGTPNPQEAR